MWWKVCYSCYFLWRWRQQTNKQAGKQANRHTGAVCDSLSLITLAWNVLPGGETTLIQWSIYIIWVKECKLLLSRDLEHCIIITDVEEVMERLCAAPLNVIEVVSLAHAPKTKHCDTIINSSYRIDFFRLITSG